MNTLLGSATQSGRDEDGATKRADSMMAIVPAVCVQFERRSRSRIEVA